MKRRAEEIAHDLDGQMTPEEVAQVLVRLEAHPAPEPVATETEALIASLRPLVPNRRTRRFRDEGLVRQPMLAFFRHLASQGRLLRPAWWLASLGISAAAVLMVPGLEEWQVPPSAFAPLLAIGSVAYGFRSLRGGALEIELSCPVTPVQIILARVLVLMSYCLTLGAGIAVLVPGSAGVALLSWSSALFLFTGLMLTLSIRLGTIPAAVVAFLFWWLQFLTRGHWFSLFAIPGGPAWAILQAVALLGGVGLLVSSMSGSSLYRLVGRGER